MSSCKSQTFSGAGHRKKYQAKRTGICTKLPKGFWRFFIDKRRRLCLNGTNPQKTLTENLSLSSSDPESRRSVRAGADEWDDLVPESVL